MRNIFKKAFLQNPTFLCSLWIGVTVACCLFKLYKGWYNNYIIFSQSFWHALDQLPLYVEYPEKYGDLFLYGIPFTGLIAPFSILPDEVGMVLWCIANSCLLFWAIKSLGFEKWKFAVVIWLSVYDLYEAVFYQQYNIGIVGLIILSFALIEKKKDFWAALPIVLGLMTKVYGVVGLAFFFFSKKKLHFLWGMICWSGILFVFPMLYSSPQYVVDSFKDWWEILRFKNELNAFCSYTNISLLGMVRKITGAAGYSDLWLILPGLALFVAPYFRVNQYGNKAFRLSFLASALLFMILFSTGTENCGYITALVAVGIWYVSTPTRRRTPKLNAFLLAFCIFLTIVLSSELTHKNIRFNYIVPYALKALPCFLIWLKIVWEQLTQDYQEDFPKSLPDAPKMKTVDIILPCYNPYTGWEQNMIDRHRELEKMLENRDIRLIVVNDGSKRELEKAAIQRLMTALPNTVIVDNKENKGKGAAVRDGLAYSDSELTLYTDYDFPYETSSIAQVIYWLEQGYDIVVANRNHTYYSKLSKRRKIASYASRFLNFILLGLTHTDTQGGLKGFNQKGKSYLASTHIKQFLFDTEFIYKASMDDTVFIKEVPVDLREHILLPNMRRGVFLKELKNLIQIAWKG